MRFFIVLLIVLFIISILLITGCSTTKTDDNFGICDDGSTCGIEDVKDTGETCPFSHVNESYPGQCGRYIDTDKNEICDLSE